MQCTTSYSVKLYNVNRIFLPTIHVYQNAVAYLIEKFDQEWEYLRSIPVTKNKRFNIAEHLVHGTKGNTPKYDFDRRFYKLPSYLRRSAVSYALGAVSGYHTRCEAWAKAGSKGRPPVLNPRCDVMPCFYRKDMYRESDDPEQPYKVFLKILYKNDWVWYPFSVSRTDMMYIQKHCQGKKQSAPSLECRHKVWYLRFAFSRNVDLFDGDIFHQRICAVDLGIHTDAVCSIMEPDGTILARKFINFPSDKDRLWTVLNRIRRYQRENGSKNVTGRWEYAKRLNDQLAYKIGSSIVDTAALYRCTTIVFEHLESGGKISGSRKQKIAMWRKNTIQKTAMSKAHEHGMRVSRICAWKTSRLAYDGSGEVIRGKDAGFKTSALCKFRNGRTYNCDLSASYNIGARYFCREIMKTLDENPRSRVEAKVPGAGRRTSCVYADLRAVWKALAELETEPGAA